MHKTKKKKYSIITTMIKTKIFNLNKEGVEDEINEFLAINGEHITQNGIATFQDRVIFYYQHNYEFGGKGVQLTVVENQIDQWTTQLINDEIELRFYEKKDVLKTEEEQKMVQDKINYFSAKVNQTKEKLHYMKQVREEILNGNFNLEEAK